MAYMTVRNVRKRRSHNQVMADRAARNHVDNELDNDVKSRIRGTYDSDDLFTMYDKDDNTDSIDDNEPDDDTLARAFVGRMQRTQVYDDFVKPYAESRGSDYELVNHEIIDLYKKFAYTGACKMDKFFTIIIIMLKTQLPTLNRRSFGILSVKYDKGYTPMNALAGINSDDYKFITTDIISNREKKD